MNTYDNTLLAAERKSNGESQLLSVRDLMGVAGIPAGRPNVIAWLRRNNIETRISRGNGGKRFQVLFSDLPEEVRVAMVQRDFGVAAQEGNPNLWADFIRKSSQVRADAERAFAAVTEIDDALDSGMSLTAAIAEASATSGLSVSSLKRMRRKVRGVPLCDWVPALAKDYKAGGATIEMDEDAWAFFLQFINQSAHRLPLTTAWRETDEVARLEGWEWPSYPTVWRRWKSMDTGQRALLRGGAKAHDKTLPTQRRTVEHLLPMQIVNLDGRKADVFVLWEDGEISRPIVIAIQDVKSKKFLGWIAAKTEDADTTKAVILDVFERYGLFDKLLTDNGRAFASNKIAGGARHRFRGKGDLKAAPGILPLLGIDITFAKPRNGRAKPIERGFRDVAEQIDTLPELKRGYCGHRPDAKPEDFAGGAIPIAVFREIYDREFRAQNARPGRRTEAAKGEMSFDQVFDEGFAKRPKRPLSAGQRWYLLMDMVYLKPNRDTGALSSMGFTWWSQEHQTTLLRYRNTKVRVLFDHTDRSKPVMVEDPVTNRVIVDSLPCMKRGEFDSTENARINERGKAMKRRADRLQNRAAMTMTKARMEEIRKRAHAARPQASEPLPETNVTAPAFGTRNLKGMSEGTASNDRDAFDESVARGLDKHRPGWRGRFTG